MHFVSCSTPDGPCLDSCSVSCVKPVMSQISTAPSNASMRGSIPLDTAPANITIYTVKLQKDLALLMRQSCRLQAMSIETNVCSLLMHVSPTGTGAQPFLSYVASLTCKQCQYQLHYHWFSCLNCCEKLFTPATKASIVVNAHMHRA